MRRALPRIASTNRLRSAAGGSSVASVSANPPITVIGVFSSCDTLATKSRRTASRRRVLVRSKNASRPPRSRSGRAVSITVRPPSEISDGSDGWPASAPASASRSSGSRGSRSAEKGTASRDVEQPPRRRVEDDHLPLRVHRGDAFLQQVDHRGHEGVIILERGEPRLELLRHAVHGVGEIADFAGRGERGAAREIAGGERLRHIAELHDRPRNAAREQRGERQRDEERNDPGGEHIAAHSRDRGVELAGVG